MSKTYRTFEFLGAKWRWDGEKIEYYTRFEWHLSTYFNSLDQLLARRNFTETTPKP